MDNLFSILIKNIPEENRKEDILKGLGDHLIEKM